MIIQTEHLGKVSVTVEKDYHNINKCYDKLTIVEEENEFKTYISRKPVPNGVELTDRNYWIPFSSLERQIVIDYNKFKNDVLFASAFHEKLDPTLPEGVAIIKQLFDKDNNPIIPKVSEEAVSDETGKTLKAKLAELTTTLSNTIDTYLNTYFADTISKAEDIVNHPTYIGEDNYVYVWNRITKTYDKTSIYTRGEGFHVSKTFASVADMEAYTGTDLKEGDFVLIQSTPDDPDNAKLYTYSGTQGVYNYLVDMSGALGFTGKTPQFSIGTIITVEFPEQASASLTPDGTDIDGNPKYKLNLALPKGKDAEEIFVKGEGINSVKHKDSTNTTEGNNAFALGEYNSASGKESFVYGKLNKAIGDRSHAEGNGTKAKGFGSHAEGVATISNGDISHSEGYGTVAYIMSHSEGIGTIALMIKPLNDSDPVYKVISGVDTLSNIFKGLFILTLVTNDDSNIHKTSCAIITNIEIKEENAELGITSEEAGIYITTDVNLLTDPSNETKAYILVNSAFTAGSHVEGSYNFTAVFNGSKSFINSHIHTIFENTLITNNGGHVEGIGNIIGGKYSHAEGALNATNNAIVHIEGKGNIANADYQHVEGKFNEPDSTAAHIIGNGTDNEHRSNAATVDWEGNLKIKGNLKDSQGNIIDTTKLVIIDDHSGAGDDPDKIYIPSAESHKQLYEGLIEDEEILSKAINIINKKFIDHINNSSLHKTTDDYELIEQANDNIAVLQKHIFNGHEYLDMSLPSGTIWASKNIGADSTFDVGSYFMWGDTKERSEASEFVATDCLYTADGVTFIDKYKKYVSPNPTRTIKRSMATKDDPANAMWGGKWKVPTFAQIEELFTKSLDISHRSNALGNWIALTNTTISYNYLMQLPVSPYLLEGNEVGDLNTIYLMYNDITGIDDFKVAKVVLSISDSRVTISSITEESVPAWAGVVIRPVIA